MKRRLALLLAIMMVLAFMLVGCNGNDETDSKTPTVSTAEAVVGTWEATVDITDAFVASLKSLDSLSDYLQFKDFELKMLIEIKDDKTYTISLDDKVTKASVDKIIDQMMDGMEAYITDELEANGINMSFEDYLAAQGMSKDDFENSMTRDMNLSTITDISASGTYTIDADRLTFTDDNSDTAVFEFKNGALEFVGESDAEGEVADMLTKILQDAIFKKQ